MQQNLTRGSVFRNILVFSVPYFLSYFLQTLYGMADLFIAGQYNGAAVITAVAVGSQLMHMLTVMIVGLAMGSTVMIARSVGAGDPEATAENIGNTVTIFALLAAGATALLLFFCPAIVLVMSTPPESVEETTRYLLICFAGLPFITAYNILSAVFRGLGDTKSPMVFIAVACAANIGLDYLFIGGFSMGAAGAALGTVLAQILSVVTAFLAIRRKQEGFSLQKEDFRPAARSGGNILKIGLPILCQDGFIQISFLVITIIANRRGVEIAAAVGIVEKIITFLFLVPSAMLAAVSAIAAQNIGAGEPERAKKTLLYATGIAVGIGTAVAVAIQFLAFPLLSRFTDDRAVVELGVQYLRTYVFDCIVAGVHFPFSGYFAACGRSMISFVHNSLSILLIRIPGAYLAGKFFPATLYAMGLAAPGGSALSALICLAVYRWMEKHPGRNTVDKKQ